MDNCSDSYNGSSLTESEKYYILLAMGTGGIAAVVICIIALAVVVFLKLYRYFVHRLAIYQVLAALFFGSVCIMEMFFINYDKNSHLYHPLCMIVGFLLEYAVSVKLMFMFCLTCHLFCFAVFYTNLQYLELLYVILSILVPLSFSWVPFIHEIYGQAGAWCWIQNWKGDCVKTKLPEGEIEEYALLYGPAFIGLTLAALAVIIIIIVLVYRAYCKCNDRSSADDTLPLLGDLEQRKKALREILPLVAYPILFIIFFAPSFVNRILGAVRKNVSYSSFMWSAITTPCLSLFAGLTLIVHIFILEFPKRQGTYVAANHGQHVDFSRSKVIKTNIFTTDTVASTDGRSQWELLAESDLDN